MKSLCVIGIIALMCSSILTANEVEESDYVIVDKNPHNADILQRSLSLFTSSHNYDQKVLTAQSLQDWTNIASSNQLKSTIEATDADLIYIQDNSSWDLQEGTSMIAVHSPSHLLYNQRPSQHSTPKILVIKHNSDDSVDYEVKAGVKMRLGGKDHGKTSGYVEAEVKDKGGNYAKGKASKESGDDGYDYEIEAGKKKK